MVLLEMLGFIAGINGVSTHGWFGAYNWLGKPSFKLTEGCRVTGTSNNAFSFTSF